MQSWHSLPKLLTPCPVPSIQAFLSPSTVSSLPRRPAQTLPTLHLSTGCFLCFLGPRSWKWWLVTSCEDMCTFLRLYAPPSGVWWRSPRQPGLSSSYPAPVEEDCAQNLLALQPPCMHALWIISASPGLGSRGQSPLAEDQHHLVKIVYSTYYFRD